jgi:hypothetical protein
MPAAAADNAMKDAMFLALMAPILSVNGGHLRRRLL